MPLNRYILDYWKHGQKAALVAYNQLRQSDAWQALNSFTDLLRAVAVALGKLQHAPGADYHPVVVALERLAGEYKSKFDAFNSAESTQKHGLLRV